MDEFILATRRLGVADLGQYQISLLKSSHQHVYIDLFNVLNPISMSSLHIFAIDSVTVCLFVCFRSSAYRFTKTDKCVCTTEVRPSVRPSGRPFIHYSFDDVLLVVSAFWNTTTRPTNCH